jgi:hypothetical protein
MVRRRARIRPAQGELKGSEGPHHKGHMESHYSFKVEMITSLPVL